MESANVIGGQYGYAFLVYYIAGIYLVLEKEGGYAGLLIAVDYGPVYGSGTTVLGQKGGVQVEGPKRGHAPDYLGQHAEGYHYLEVGLESAELLYEERIFELFGLKNRYSLLHGVFLDGAALKHASMTTHWLIGHGYHTYYIIMVFHETAQYMLGKLGSSHEHYPHLFLFHVGYKIKQVGDILLLTVTPQKVQVRHFGTN